MRYLVPGLFLLFCVLISVPKAYGQRETEHWFFGNRAGLKFSGSLNPSVITTGKMRALEGCASISDSLGNLLFYTAGDTVFNRFHFKMNNGWPLTGHQSASQAAVIVEQPYTNLHYLFTVDAMGGLNSLRYSVVNANANSLTGTVLAKNLAVPGAGPQFPVAEKITAVNHRYSRDVWVIARGAGSQNDNFYAYRVTAAGIQPPVVSAVGTSQAGSYPNFKTIGYMKASPDGRKLALAIQELNLVELYDFNDSSGVVSNPVQLRGILKPYGVEFSRNGSKLYVSVDAASAAIRQFDLEAGGGQPDSVQSSQVTVGVTHSVFPPALQLALNGRIYVANTDQPPGNRFLSVINQPDSAANKTGFRVNSLDLTTSPTQKQRSEMGLPNFNQSYLWAPTVRVRNICVGQPTLFSLDTKRRLKSVFWNFNDLNAAKSTSTELNPAHQFSAPGLYAVNLTVTLLNNRTYRVTVMVTISPLPTVSLGPDQKMCANGAVTLAGTGNGEKFLWNTGSDSSAITVTQPGIYWLEVLNAQGCRSRDSVVVYPAPAPAYLQPKTVETCPFEPVVLRYEMGKKPYLWSTGSTDSAITVTKAGWYTVSFLHDGCRFTDSIQVVYKTCPEDFMVPNIITPNGDQANDKFEFRGFPAGSFSLKLFNRWGQLVYETEIYRNDWPQQQPKAGLYYYQLQHLETKQLYKGWLEVIN